MANKVYEKITDLIISKLEQGIIPWSKPWNVVDGGMPCNLKTKKAYRGVNVLMTMMQGYGSPYWVTFNQCKGMGGHVRKGEKGTPIVFWNSYVKKNADDEEYDVWFLKQYTIFNVEQCNGLDKHLPEPVEPAEEFDAIANAETIVDGMPRKPVMTSGGNRAYYRPATDTVNMPARNQFNDAEGFYGTLFHELVHSTGHQTRLDRKGITTSMVAFGDETYSQEELVAELGAAFLCGEAGISDLTIDNSAAYIKGWLKALKDDKKMVVYAGSQAQKAADFIMGRKVS